MSRFKFAIIGGDFRYKYLCDMLCDNGYTVKSYENSYIENLENSLEDTIEHSDIVIAPIPCTKDNETIFLTTGGEIKVKELVNTMAKFKSKLFIGGVIPQKLKKQLNSNNIKVFDFFEQESVAVLNAIPTAEGTIQTIMEESDRTIFGSKSLILGYGRCGKILANMLKGIGSDVSVTYRREEDSAYIKGYGYRGINLSEIKSYIKDFDFIINTIPTLIINKELLKRTKKTSLILDLSQAPGGVDFEFARDLNIKALYCPGLPGRVAPYTAGEILKDAILNICFTNLPS